MGEPDINLTKIDLPVAPADAARVIDAVIDLFSPLTETMGALGDHVRLFRTNGVLRILSKTRSLASEAGYTLKRPPLRFLVPFLEEASLQGDDDDPELQTMWANLLLQAGQDDSQANRMMVDLLARLSSRDAANLERIVRNARAGTKSVNQIVDAAFDYDRFHIDKFLDDTVGKQPDRDDLEPDETEERYIGKIINELEDRGVIVLSCAFYSFAANQAWDLEELHPDFAEDDLSLHTLAALGLIRFPLVSNRDYRGGLFSMTLCVLTALGAEFYLSTHDPKLREAGSQLPSFDG